jgi:serine/threonine protein kinase/formylglycine-generating enzyme required for sulfatase activity
MNHSPEDDTEPTIKGVHAADLIARGLESAKAATGNPQVWQPPTPEELAALLPQYEIEALLGRGGMGAVYRGRQAALDRAVAIKLLPAELAADAEFMSRFQREARTLAKLQHPGIVAVHDFGQTSQGHLYFVMEFVNGTDLARLIHGPGVNPAQALEVIAQVCEALQYAHSQGVIHRDIKPANVLLTQEGRAKLADFGLARPTSEETASLTRSNVVMGTPDYMAPEQMAGNADHRADLYALGVMLYEMLTGQTPRGAWAPPSQRVEVDVRLDQVVVRALQQDPAMRYQQASEIKTDVDVIRTTPLPKAGKAKAKSAPEAPGQRTAPLPKAKKPGSKFAIAAAIILPLLAVAGMVAFSLVKKPAASSSHPPGEKAKLPWQRIDHTEAEWAKLGNTVENGWVNLLDIHKGKPVIVFDMLRTERALSKFAVRARAMYHEDGNGHVDLSCRDNENATTGSIQFWRNHMTVRQQLAADSQRYPVPASVGDECEFEAVFLEGKVHARFNGGPVFSFAQETSIPCVALTISGSKASVRDIEYVNLDGLPDPLKALGWEVAESEPAPSLPWQKLTQSSPNWDDKVLLVDGDGWIEFKTTEETPHQISLTAAAPSNNPGLFRDTALRVHYRWNPQQRRKAGLYLSARNRAESGRAETWLTGGGYALDVSGGDGANWQRMLPQPLKLAEEGTFELAVIGQRMLVRLNGQVLLDKVSTVLNRTGSLNVRVQNCLLRDIEHVNLDGIPDPLKALGWEVPTRAVTPTAAASATASPATATKDQPFVNSLGMKFVPVPITGGPTGGRRVLFSIWETRVQDFEVFADENLVTWSPANMPQGPSHPAVMVSREHARTFCAWLTERERKAGKLGANELYRLPTDHEWSCAVGIGDREDPAKTPSEKRGGMGDLFPWGRTWPPPAGAGNFSGEEAIGHELAKPNPNQKTLMGYRDDFIWTAPAGSFTANGSGIFDLSGNVSEWCEDWMDASQKNHVVRGSSWQTSERSTMLMSFRLPSDANVVTYFTGFRCVLVSETSERTLKLNRGAGPVTNDSWQDLIAEHLAKTPAAKEATTFVDRMVGKRGGIEWKKVGSGWQLQAMSGDRWFSVLRAPAARESVRLKYSVVDPKALGTVFVRLRGDSDKQGYKLGMMMSGKGGVSRNDGADTKEIASANPIPDFDPTQPHTIELKIEGTHLMMLVDGTEVASAEDNVIPPGGSVQFQAQTPIILHAFEYRAEADPAEAKKRLVEARAHLKAGEAAEARKITEEALATAPGDLATMAEAALIFAEAQAPERASLLAGEFVKQAPAEHPQFAAITELRVKLGATMKQYQARLEAAAKLVTANDDAGEQRELQAALQLVPDGREAAARLEKNPLHIGRPLPGRRWAGALGHTYVPVDGLANVLFSTWETRVKDFEQFVKETGHDMSQPRDDDHKEFTWQKPGFEQTGDHPVVLVSREDARDFCDWITKKERAAGRLLPGQLYRLPTDREWSAAMGVLNEPGDFPCDRVFPEDVFTWPQAIPTPRNAENLNWDKDDFQSTAPVGSGIPNRFGIHDLLGNVMEICADPWGIMDDHGHDAAAVLRGSAYNRDFKVQRMRIADVHSGRQRVGLSSAGFRCVLDLKSAAQRAIQTQMEEAVAKLRALDAGKSTPTQEINTLVNDEMVLMDLRRWGPLNELESTKLAGLPLTHLMAYCAERQQSMAVLKTFPLKAVRLSLEASENTPRLIENLRGLPLTHVNLSQHPSSGMPTKTLEALSGASLRQLHLGNLSKLQNIEPLRGMPLEVLAFSGPTGQIDLSPVKDAPIRKIELPSSISMDGLLLACDWWAGRAQSIDGDVVNTINRCLRDAALTGDPAKVAEVKQTLMAKFADTPSLKLWAAALNEKSVIQSLDSCARAARLISGDATTFEGQFHTFQGHAYLWWDQKLTLDDAISFAVKLGGHVVTITTKEENDFIIQQTEAGVFQRNFTLGMERTGPGRITWRWVTGEPLEYHNWRPDAGIGSDAAVFIQDKGQWVWLHFSKTDRRPFIIEWDTPTPQPPVKK